MKLEATAATSKGSLQPRPVRHRATNDGLQGAVDDTVKLGISTLDVAGRAGTEEERNLGEGETGAQKDALNLGITQAMQSPKRCQSRVEDLVQRADRTSQEGEAAAGDRDVSRKGGDAVEGI